MRPAKPIVVFEHGLLSGSFAWSWVLSRLPRSVIPIVTDRNARSTFEVALRRLDYRTVLGRLRSMTPAIDESERIILVGHSIGGLLIRAHANALGSPVRGMVYVDASSPEQFNSTTDVSFQFLRLQQVLLKRTIRSSFAHGPLGGDAASLTPLPHHVRQRAADLLADRCFWLNAYRESRSIGTSWLDAAQFPASEHRPTAIVSSGISTNPESIQHRFERRLLAQTTPSRHVLVREATHESVLYNEDHSRAVNAAIEWVLDHPRTAAP